MGQTPDQLYERMLVVRCQAGDAGAFEELVGRYQPRLSYFLRKLMDEWDGAEDLLQDVWLDVFRSVPRLTDPAAFAAWVYRIARDRAYRELRRRVKLLIACPDFTTCDDPQLAQRKVCGACSIAKQILPS